MNNEFCYNYDLKKNLESLVKADVGWNNWEKALGSVGFRCPEEKKVHFWQWVGIKLMNSGNEKEVVHLGAYWVKSLKTDQEE